VAPLVLGLWFLSLIRGTAVTAEWLQKARSPEREVIIERAFLKAQLALASTDSINIILDVRAQELDIVLKGVRLRKCELHSAGADQAIRKLISRESEDLWLERPFTLLERRGNLPDPWKPVAEGPLDTLKGATLARELPMDGELVFDRGLVVHIRTPMSSADSLEYRGIGGAFKSAGRKVNEIKRELSEIFTGPVTMDVFIRLSREDGAAVLRALPVGGGMALHL
jgi:hypothetical protein